MQRLRLLWSRGSLGSRRFRASASNGPHQGIGGNFSLCLPLHLGGLNDPKDEIPLPIFTYAGSKLGTRAPRLHFEVPDRALGSKLQPEDGRSARGFEAGGGRGDGPAAAAGAGVAEHGFVI